MIKAKELSKTTKVEEPANTLIEKDPSTGNPVTGNPVIGNPDTGNPDTGNPDTGNPNTGKVEEVKKEEEVIIFSDNHSLDDYIVGR